MRLPLKNTDMEHFEFTFKSSTETGGVKMRVPYCQYVLNDNQQFCVVGIDFDKFDGGFNAFFEADKNGVKTKPMVFEMRVVNSLANDNWNFEQHPNPELILMTITPG